MGKSSAHLFSIPYTTTEWGVLCRPLRVLARMEGSGAVQTMMLCCPLAIDECNVPAEPMQQHTGVLNVMCSGNVFPCTLHYAAVNQR